MKDLILGVSKKSIFADTLDRDQTFMDERFEKVHKMLIEQKQEILQKIRKRKDELTNQGGDFIDIATDSLEHELNYIFEEREREKLQNIDQALKRIQEGTYGECEECGDDIELERLLALPFTRLCLDCKSKQERQRKLKIYVDQDS
jgi:DnaK suppressor protein